MRLRKIFKRDPRSDVQITPVPSTRDAFRDLANGKVVEFPSTIGQGSFDFESAEVVDFESPLMQEAPNKMELAANPQYYGFVESVQDPTTPKPPVPPSESNPPVE